MPGPPPKPAALRQRRNKAATRATLKKPSRKRKVPPLPEFLAGRWHPGVIAWWEDVWRSPMAAEYLDADRHRLYRIAYLMHDFWATKDRKERLALAAEIRNQEMPLGLTPIDRRRLQWEVEKGEQAEERTATRRSRKAAEKVTAKDPRDVLKVVA